MHTIRAVVWFPPLPLLPTAILPPLAVDGARSTSMPNPESEVSHPATVMPANLSHPSYAGGREAIADPSSQSSHTHMYVVTLPSTHHIDTAAQCRVYAAAGADGSTTPLLSGHVAYPQQKHCRRGLPRSVVARGRANSSARSASGREPGGGSARRHCRRCRWRWRWRCLRIDRRPDRHLCSRAQLAHPRGIAVAVGRRGRCDGGLRRHCHRSLT